MIDPQTNTRLQHLEEPSIWIIPSQCQGFPKIQAKRLALDHTANRVLDVLELENREQVLNVGLELILRQWSVGITFLDLCNNLETVLGVTKPLKPTLSKQRPWLNGQRASAEG